MGKKRSRATPPRSFGATKNSLLDERQERRMARRRPVLWNWCFTDNGVVVTSSFLRMELVTYDENRRNARRFWNFVREASAYAATSLRHYKGLDLERLDMYRSSGWVSVRLDFRFRERLYSQYIAKIEDAELSDAVKGRLHGAACAAYCSAMLDAQIGLPF